MPITNGTISILRRVRTGDFEHIEPHVTISFSVEPNEDAEQVANGVRQIVDAQYKHLLGIPVEGEKKTRKEKPAPLPEAAPSTPGPVPPTATPPATVAPPSPTVPPASGAAFNAAGQPASPPTALAGAASPPVAAVPSSVAGTSTPAPSAVVPAVAPVAPAAGPSTDATGLISEETMAKRCQDKTDELNALYEPGVGLQKVVALIRQYIDPPGRATQIPPARRGEFLTQLAALA